MQKQIFSIALLTALVGQVTAEQSLMEIYQQAVSNDPSLKIAQLNVDSAQQDVVSGFANVIPSVTTAASYSVSNETTDDKSENLSPDFDVQTISGSISVSQTFALAAFTAYDALKQYKTVEEMTLAKTQNDLLVTVAEKYINALRAKDAYLVANAQLEAVERQFEQTEQRYEVGLVAVTDVLDAEATLDQTRVSLIRAESQYDISLQDLYTLTGSVPEGIKSIADTVPVSAPAANGQQQWIDYAVANHPDILIAEKGLEVGTLTYRAQRENLLPSAQASVSISYADQVGSDDLSSNDEVQNWSTSLSLSVSMDLYSGGKKFADIAKQGIANNISMQNIEILKRGKTVEVANLYRTVQADAQNVDAQAQSLESRQSALQATNVGYEVGTRNIVEVLNAQLAVFNAESSLNNARYDYLLNLLKLKRAAGQLTIADLESIEEYLIDE